MSPWKGLPENKHDFFFFLVFVLCGWGIEVSRKPVLLQNSVSRREFLPPPTVGVDSGSRGVPLSLPPPPHFFHTSETQAKRDMTLNLPAAGKLGLRLIKKKSVK